LAVIVEKSPMDLSYTFWQCLKIWHWYCEKSRKPTGNIIDKNRSFYHRLSNVKFVCVLGHSIAAVDQPDFREVIEAIDVQKVPGLVSCHEEGAGTAPKNVTGYGPSCRDGRPVLTVGDGKQSAKVVWFMVGRQVRFHHSKPVEVGWLPIYLFQYFFKKNYLSWNESQTGTSC